MNIGVSRVGSVPSSWETNRAVVVGWWDTKTPESWTPSFLQGQDYPDVPQDIGEPASEAHQTFSIGAIRSSVLMARSVIEAVAKDHGIHKGPLVAKIDALSAANLIKDFTKDTAHVIRAFGNDMAHGDFGVPLDKEDAEGVLDFMDLLLREVYQDPAKLKALKSKADARKATPAP
ncbi:DUF4145 domain-containing protein [Arthrobacter jinronghuae]|nr:DUF4145 domain-containing protein [Arthrobacter jinronghuae]UWX80273.1 DUF4145 domain-containing protein [Arthrobacter jinronghuae]